MAYEVPANGFTLPATTGLTKYRFVTMNTSGKLAYPSLGAAVVGVINSHGTTASTEDPQYVTVVDRGIVKVEAGASTQSAGDLVAASSIGRAVASTAGSYVVGRIVAGSSGGAGRIVSVQLLPIGTT